MQLLIGITSSHIFSPDYAVGTSLEAMPESSSPEGMTRVDNLREQNLGYDRTLTLGRSIDVSVFGIPLAFDVRYELSLANDGSGSGVRGNLHRQCWSSRSEHKPPRNATSPRLEFFPSRWHTTA